MRSILLECGYVVKKILIVLIFVLGVIFRIGMFDQEGGDQLTYKKTVLEFANRINPYEYTVQSYKQHNLKHGYAYMPSLLYVQYFFYQINTFFDLDIPLRHLWKIPVLLSDIGVGLLLLHFSKTRDYMTKLLILIFWFFNPHIIFRHEYTLYDPIAIVFLLLSYVFLQKKNSFWVGVFYAMSFSFKTFAIILFPLFFLKAKSKLKFLLGGLLLTIIISVPFIRDLSTYVNGAFLVHGNRVLQGRPIITFLQYYVFGHVTSLWQAVYTEYFVYLAIAVSWVSGLIIYKKSKNVFISSMYSFVAYYFFTPVLNRTHILWGLPFILIGLYDYMELRKFPKIVYYLAVVGLWFVLGVYLYVWNKGFHVYGQVVSF